MATISPVKSLRKQYQRLAGKLSRVGLIAQGTITERMIEKEDKDRPGETKKYGPYYQWTFKENGKTVTVNLSKAQVGSFRLAIENHRRMEGIVAEMRALSLAILQNSALGVKKRKPRTSALK